MLSMIVSTVNARGLGGRVKKNKIWNLIGPFVITFVRVKIVRGLFVLQWK